MALRNSTTPAAWAAALLAFLFLLLGAPRGHAQSAWKVVVHESNPMSVMSRDQVARLFLKKANAWPDGRPVAPVDQREDAPVRVAFTREVLGKSIAAVKAYWQQQIFSGRAVPPPEESSDDRVARFVSEHPLGVGYVSPGAPVPGLKVLRLVD